MFARLWAGPDFNFSLMSLPAGRVMRNLEWTQMKSIGRKRLAPRPDLNESALESPKTGSCGEVASNYWILVKLKLPRPSSTVITKVYYA